MESTILKGREGERERGDEMKLSTGMARLLTDHVLVQFEAVFSL